MARTRRLSTIAALIVCLVGTQCTSTLFASDEQLLPPTTEHLRFTLNDEVPAATASVETAGARVWHRPLEFAPLESSAFAQRGGRGGGGHRNGAAAAGIMIGTVAAAVGAGMLIYANRPECDRYPNGTGCGYGTKVAGGVVLSVGIVGIIVGAARWR